jgi:hypothetical protein
MSYRTPRPVSSLVGCVNVLYECSVSLHNYTISQGPLMEASLRHCRIGFQYLMCGAETREKVSYILHITLL